MPRRIKRRRAYGRTPASPYKSTKINQQGNPHRSPHR